ncbi:MAG: hypothetical protein EKK46_12415 [Rhodocyclaceae bacterium]|nr:MAG: hypothetical protein EKK46_12415 [Rhodocyclaceae bacterium]
MNDPVKGSSAHAPDLDWSQVRETVLMLELAAGQVEAAMKDSNTSVGVLTDTFTSLADTLVTVDVALDTLPDSVGNGLVKAEIREGTRQIGEKVHQAIIAFQFYDKLVQRLDHVCASLAGLSVVVSDRAKLYNPDEWLGLQQRIRDKYTMEEERAMFDAVLQGMTVKDALAHYMQARMQQVEESGGDVELF